VTLQNEGPVDQVADVATVNFLNNVVKQSLLVATNCRARKCIFVDPVDANDCIVFPYFRRCEYLFYHLGYG